jgi:DeoR/GlpR family transcriptional regulator of sugar metabolism
VIPAKRYDKILDLIREKRTVEVEELSSFFHVSEATIRHDLNLLANRNLIVRTRGGAIIKENESNGLLIFSDRIKVNAEKKRSIGSLAASLVVSGSSIFLDASTTALYVARAIKERNDLRHITVVTNGINTAIELVDRPDITTILLGGILYSRNISLNGLFVEDQVKGIYGQKGFFGAKGLTLQHGLTEVSIQEARTKIAMMERCQEIIAILDSSKLGQVGSMDFVSLDKINSIVMDGDAPAEMVAELEQRGIRVLLA